MDSFHPTWSYSGGLIINHLNRYGMPVIDVGCTEQEAGGEEREAGVGGKRFLLPATFV